MAKGSGLRPGLRSGRRRVDSPPVLLLRAGTDADADAFIDPREGGPGLLDPAEDGRIELLSVRKVLSAVLA
jgi:hypothetical protein